MQTSGDDTLAAEMVGMMHLHQTHAAARQGHADGAYDHLNEASEIAARTGERNGIRRHFGPTNVAMWRLSVGVELSQGGEVSER